MAEKRAQGLDGPIHVPGIRAAILEKYRDLLAHVPDHVKGGPWPLCVRTLERGEPFACQRWQLPGDVVREVLPLGDAYSWWLLEGDVFTPTNSPVERSEESSR